jgi:hypothetical protein
MKKTARLFLTSTTRFLATALLLATSLLPTIAHSQSPNPLYQHLPPSANHIYSIRLGQIITKGELLGLLNNIPMKDPNAAKFLNILKDPASAGVDIDHEILIAQIAASGNGADTLSFTQIIVPLTDSAKFRSAFMKGEHVHHAPGKGATVTHAKDAMSWNDRLLVATQISIERPAPGTAHKPAPGVHRPLGEQALEKSLASLVGYPTNALLTDQRFVAAFATDEDVHAWSTRMDFMAMISKFAKKMAAKSPAMQGKPFPDYNNIGQIPHPPVLSTFSFENGRIVFRMTTFNKPEDAAILQRIYDRRINKALLARVPGDLLLGWGAVHFNPAALPDLLDKYQTRQMVDSMLGKKGLGVSDIAGIFGGDFLVAALADTTATTDTTKKKVHVYFVATLGDPAKMMQVAAKVAASSSASADTVQAAKMKKLADKMVIRDNLLVIGGSKELANKYFDNKGRPSDPPSTGPIERDTSFQRLVINLKAVSAYVLASMPANPKAMLMARILQQLEEVKLNTTFDGNNTVLTFQIVTGDPSTNS